MAQFEAPQRRDYIPMLFNLLQRREEDTAQQERYDLTMRERKAEEAMNRGLDFIEKGVPMKSILPFVSRDLDFSRMEALKGIGQTIEKQRKQAEQADPLLKNLTAGAAVPGSRAGVPGGASPEFQRIAGQAQAFAEQQDPDFAEQFRALIPQAVQAGATQRIGVEEERKYQLGQTLGAEARGETRSIRAEERADTRGIRNEQVNALALAFSGGDPLERTQALERVVRRFPNDADYIVDRAANLSIADAVEAGRTASGAQGPTDLMREAEAIANNLNRTRPPDKQITINDGLLVARKSGFPDPISGDVMVGTEDMRKRRSALATIGPLIDEVEASLQDIGRDAAAKTGGILGTPGIADAFRVLGMETQSVAGFRGFAQALLIKAARMDQDARLSDFDLRLWLAVIPSLIDARYNPDGTLSPQAQGRLNTLRRLVELETQSPFDKGESVQEVRRLRAEAGIDTDPALDKLARKVRAEAKSGTLSTDTMNQIMRQGTPSPEARDLLDRFNATQGTP